MTPAPVRILFASRAYESPHIEGGFLLLKDLADRSAGDPEIKPGCFSASPHARSSRGVSLLPAFSATGWSLGTAAQFALALQRSASEYDIVHTAHVPTRLNTNILRRIRRGAETCGTRFVQTITALPERTELRPELFWGDAVVCLNEEAAERARQCHDNVHMIAPAIGVERLFNRPSMPVDVRDRISGHRVICIPVDLLRIGEFDLYGLCRAILKGTSDAAIVFACRFGEEEIAKDLLGPLGNQYDDRVHVFATIDWMLDLLAASDAVVYPIQDLHKKFNPPLVLLEAAALGSRIITPTTVLLKPLMHEGSYVQPTSAAVADWATAVVKVLDRPRGADALAVSFDDVYAQYAQLYRSLRESKAA